MKKSIEDVSQVVKRLKVEIPREVVEKKKDESFLKIQKKAEIKGFRPGKAPLSIIKTRFRQSVIEQLEEDLVKEGYFEAVKDSDIKAVAITEIKEGKYVEGEDFRFTALIEVLPSFEPTGYEDIHIEPIKQEVTDEEVTGEIDRMREAQSVYKPVERESRKDDLLEISFKAESGGEVIEEQENSTYLLSEVSALGDEFDKNLMGKKAGELLDFVVTHPDDFTVERVRGKRVRYLIGVKSVKEKVLPDADDEFAKSIPDVDSLDDLKSKIRVHLKERKEVEERKRQEDRLFDALLEKNPIDVPQTLVDEEINRMVSDTHRRLKAQGVQFDPRQIDMGKLGEKYRENAIRAVKSSLVIGAIAKKESIEATEEDLKEELKRIGENYNISYEKVASYYEDEDTKKSLSNAIRERKVIEFFLKDSGPDAEKEG